MRAAINRVERTPLKRGSTRALSALVRQRATVMQKGAMPSQNRSPTKNAQANNNSASKFHSKVRGRYEITEGGGW